LDVLNFKEQEVEKIQPTRSKSLLRSRGGNFGRREGKLSGRIRKDLTG